MDRRIKKLIRQPNTQKKSLSDFPLIHQYLVAKFPHVDVSHIPIYVVSSATMDAAGFREAGGFYIHHLGLVAVRKIIKIGDTKTQSKFIRTLYKQIKTDVQTEDVLVHEMIHAISGECSRSNRRFTFNEEEFVYTNSIDFYKQKGMTDDDIVNKNFIPFCLQDVLSDKDELSDIFFKFEKEYNFIIPSVNFEDMEQLNKFLDRYTQKLVPMVLNRAREIGFYMISLYNKYGKGLELSEQPLLSDDDIPRALDFGDDDDNDNDNY